MNIGIDITPLQTGHKDRGVGKYTELLIESLQRYERKHSYYFFTRGQKVPKNIDLIHYPYFDPFFVTLPLFYSKPAVITVHDLIPLVFPERFPSGVRGAIAWQYQKLRLTRAKRIIADSHCSKKDIGRITSAPPAQIDVIHLAPNLRCRRIQDRSTLARVQKRYNLPDGFVLYVGDVNWNKNILGLLKAISKCKATKLVLAGKAFLEQSIEAREIEQYIRNENLEHTVMSIGHAPEEDLVAIYNLTSAYLQPSFYEGFGLPVLEAMACGAPVVSSRASSLGEIAGPAITVDPEDPDDIARGIKEALTLSAEKRTALVVAQNAWVKTFTWQRVTHETVHAYEKACS